MRLNLSSSAPLDEQRLANELRRVQSANEEKPARITSGKFKRPQRQKQQRPEVPPEVREMRRKNAGLPIDEVLARLKAEAPAAFALAQIVGRWVWVTFPDNPGEAMTELLKNIGFHWSRKRSAWQHACGAWTGHSKSDPRGRYASAPASEFAETETAEEKEMVEA